MGNYISRRSGGVEELDLSSNNAFHYPPKSGCYFGSHFIMGGERFETVQPEIYLFGENNDLNFLGNRPSQFPYPVPQTGEPTLTLKSLLNIRKDSIRLIRSPASDVQKSRVEPCPTPGPDSQKSISAAGGDTARTRPLNSANLANTVAPAAEILLADVKPNKEVITPQPVPTTAYNIEFTFDADIDCIIKIYYFASEECNNEAISYTPKISEMTSISYRYKKGSDQVFCQPSHVLEPSKYPDEDWLYNSEKESLPIVIHCVSDDTNHPHHSHSTFCVLERVSSHAYMLKTLKQKQCIDGLTYLLQEIYGIENKYSQYAKEDDLDESGCECVICMCDFRDTLILPCRHLCLCHSCADNLRYQASNCPICRSPFRALLQIRALQRKLDSNGENVVAMSSIDDTRTIVVSPEASATRALANDSDGLPSGYEAISLIEALNGQHVNTPGASSEVAESVDQDIEQSTDDADTTDCVTGDDVIVDDAISNSEIKDDSFEEVKMTKKIATSQGPEDTKKSILVASAVSSCDSDTPSSKYSISKISKDFSETEDLSLRGVLNTSCSAGTTDTDGSSSASSGQALLTSHLAAHVDILDDFLDAPIAT